MSAATQPNLATPETARHAVISVTRATAFETSINVFKEKSVGYPSDTSLASAQIHALRNQLLKLAAVITRNTRRIRLYFASHWPSASIFQTALHALNSG